MSRLLIDLDNTIADWEARFIELMTEHSPHIPLLPYGTRTHNDLKRDKTPQEALDTQKVLSMPGFYSGLEWYPGAKEAIIKLSEAGHDIHFCSMPSRWNDNSAGEKYTWIKQGLGEEWADRLTVTFKKRLVRGDFLIDDHEQEVDSGTEWEQILYTQSYNSHLEGFRTFNGWENYQLLEELIK